MTRSGTKPSKTKTRRVVLLASGLAIAGAAALFVWPSFTGGQPANDAPPPSPTRYRYTIVNAYPHDREAFTQGLIFRDGVLFESTGLNGKSSLRRVRLETGEVLKRVDLDSQYFGEGLVDWRDSLMQLTWLSHTGFIYDLESFERRRQFRYTGEGWGLARDNTRLIMSDGTSTLRFLDPDTLAETGRLTVTERGFPVNNLNELEMVRGELFANIFQTDEVVVIDPGTGYVTGRIDFSGLRSRLDQSRPIDVFNGIAYDEAGDRLFVTGKLWPQLFEVRIIRD